MGLIWKLSGGKWGAVLGAVLLILASPLLAPQLLAFPHKVDTEIGTVWSEERLDPVMLEAATSEARARFERSPLASEDEQRWIFVTNGGWRWHYIANVTADAFAITRPFSPAITVNRTDPATGIVTNGRTIGGERSLPGLIAHEFTHGMIDRRYGILASRRFPEWKVEGYCEHVAGETSLDAEEVAKLKASGEDHPAILYFEARARVEAILAENGGSPDALFESD